MRSLNVRFGEHSYGQCSTAIRSDRVKRGWFATGYNVPEVGPIRWGRLAWLRAFIDSASLAWRHRNTTARGMS